MDIKEGKRLLEEAKHLVLSTGIGPAQQITWSSWTAYNAEAMIARIEELEAELDALKGRTCGGCGRHNEPSCPIQVAQELADGSFSYDEYDEPGDLFPACGYWEAK